MNCKLSATLLGLFVLLKVLSMALSHNSETNEVKSSNTNGISRNALDAPDWLQNIPSKSQVGARRKRRFLTFPTASTVKITILFTIPVAGVGDSTAPVTISTNFVINLPTMAAAGRRMDEFVGNDLIDQFESYIGSFGLDGHACTLRAICEIAEMPFDHGRAGELVNMLFSMSGGHPGSNATIYDEYSTAEYYGQHHGDCGRLYPLCSTSITDFISNVI